MEISSSIGALSLIGTCHSLTMTKQATPWPEILATAGIVLHQFFTYSQYNNITKKQSF